MKNGSNTIIQVEHPSKNFSLNVNQICCPLNLTSVNCQFWIKIGTMKSTKPEASQLKVMGDTRTNISGTGKHLLPQRQYYSVLERSSYLLNVPEVWKVCNMELKSVV